MVFPSITTAIDCEATTIQQALQTAFDIGFNRVVFEIGCQEIYSLIVRVCFYLMFDASIQELSMHNFVCNGITAKTIKLADKKLVDKC